MALPLRSPALGLGAVLLALAGRGEAHSFGVIYTLPLPFWLYAWAAGATLIVSFLMVGWLSTRAPARPEAAPAATPHRIPPPLIGLLRGLALLALALCIITGLWGTPNPYGNLSMTLFWIVFVLGFAYLTALIGNLWALINPWRTLALGIARIWPRYGQGCWRYPARLASWPAFALYLGFIWVELLGGYGPRGLALLLLGYTVFTLGMVGVFGLREWFRHGEFFSVLFAWLARLAPVHFRGDDEGEPLPWFGWRWPLSGALSDGRETLSGLCFVLLLLAATAFDGLHETEVWHGVYWLWLYPEGLSAWLGTNPLVAYPKLRAGYVYWQSAWLLLAPFLYLGVYLGGIALMRALTDRRQGLWALAARFAPSLLPIVLVYHLTHYYTLLQTQGLKVLALISDPFGRGQNWFGTADWFSRSNVPDVYWVWHVQVGLIVLGHIASVYLAHLEALRCFGARGRALRSQLPMLALMVAFTVAGLWILSQPFQGGR
jgi:hypothetical protein